MQSGASRGLKPCASFVRSFSRPRCRHHSSATVLIGEDLGPTEQGDHQTFRVRKDGTKLPLPPILDPIVREERGRWEQKKARPDVSKFTPFQKKLWENPYAHILASPVRQCRGTNVLLPSDLMVALNPRFKPDTSDLWLLPVSLTTRSKGLGISYRFSGRKVVVETLSKKQRWKAGLISFSEIFGAKASKTVWREDMPELILSLQRKKLVGKLKWHVQNSGRFIRVDSPSSEDIDGVEEVGCVLYMGSLKTRADELQARAEKIGHATHRLATKYADQAKRLLDPHLSKEVTHVHPNWWLGPVVPQLKQRVLIPPLEFKTTWWRGSKVPVYSLFDLLGEEKLSELMEGSKFVGERCLVMKRGRHNVPIEVLLMQMQQYLVRPGP